MIPKPDTDIRKLNYRPIFIMTIVGKIRNKTLENGIKQYTKRWHQEQVEFTPGIQGWFKTEKLINIIYHSNRLKKKNHVIISIDAEKLVDKI